MMEKECVAVEVGSMFHIGYNSIKKRLMKVYCGSYQCCKCAKEVRGPHARLHTGY